METLSINYLIKDSPAAVAILDREMCFVGHSDEWLYKFNIDDDIIGRSYYDVIPHSPPELNKIYRKCLTGKTDRNKGKKFLHKNGRVQWLKWKINPWKNADDSIGGLMVVLVDITEEKRKEELLMKAMNVARIGGWEIDLMTNVVTWTEVTKEIHEVPEDYVPSLEEGINFYKEGEHREKITQLVSEAISNGASWDTELQIVTAKGREVWVRAKGETEIVDNKCVRIFGTFQDIDEKKKAELSYKKVSDRLAIATAAADIGIWDYDIVKNQLIWDDNMYKLYGVKKEDFQGVYEAWQAGLHPDDKERGDKEIAMALSGEKDFDTEFRVIWPSGEIRHIKAIAYTRRDSNGKAVEMIGTNWDITELKNTQLQLERSKESFAGAFENSTVGMALVGLDGKWLQVNDSLCNSLGYTQDELSKLTFQDITHPDDLNKDLERLQELISGKRDSYQIEKRYFHKKGHLVHIILTVTAFKDINGELSHFISQIVDISSRIEAEKKLTKLLNVTGEQNKSLLNFAHIVSHNLRSHSSNLSMLTGFIRSEEDEEERKNLVNMLGGASESLNETVLHLNEVVQVKVGASENMKTVAIYKTILNVQKNVGLLLKEKSAKAIIDVPKDLKIKVIPAYLDSILLNLFTNSIKYCSPNRDPIIKITAKEKHGEIIISFADNGLGIDLERHGGKLFGMYKTFHRNKDAKGIGLFITKNQIEAMNGSIEVESKVDKGTTFKLHFEKH